jgi:CHAD domain-containing protein
MPAGFAAPDFRDRARMSLKRAKSELESHDPHRLRYAVLELRDAMEALTYDRLRAYRAEIPPEEYATWQPRKVVAMLSPRSIPRS